MAQNVPQRKETPPGPLPNSPSLLFEYQCRSGKFIRLANRIEKNRFGSENRIESKLFRPNWNALPQTKFCPYYISLQLTQTTFCSLFSTTDQTSQA